MFGIIRQHIRRSIYPHVVSPIRFGDRIITDDEATSVGTFIFVFFAAFFVIAVILSLIGLDAATSLSAAAATLGNVGPGVTPGIGPAGTYAGLPDSAKVVLSLAMIMGRLEVLSLLLLLMPSFYR
jgi:trk system potassium uptake protein TrkH